MMRVCLVLSIVALVNSACLYKAMAESECPHATAAPGTSEAGAPEHTFEGCTCSSICGAGGNIPLNCDWCRTEGGCGRSGLGGSWDYCKYNKNATYTSLSRAAKQALLWEEISSNNTSGSYPNIAGIFTESVQTSFDSPRDVMPEGRKKYIHSVGAVCRFNLTMASNSPYTGVFQAGRTARGLIRLGSALAVSTTSGLTPGVGVKFLRDNVHSGNFVALHTLSPLPNNDYNFFAADLSNHIPAPSSTSAKLLVQKFNQASGCPTQVGLSDIAAFTLEGKAVEQPVFPFQVIMSTDLTFPSTPCTQKELQARLAALQPGTQLYHIATYASPEEALKGGPPTPLGTLNIEGACTNSAFGDGHLFYQHQRIEEDWALRPEWMKLIDPEKACFASSISDVPPKPCKDF